MSENKVSLAELNEIEEEILEGYRAEVDANARSSALPPGNYSVEVKFVKATRISAGKVD
jgi:hypothetical protein